jgi:hypothetical protein
MFILHNLVSRGIALDWVIELYKYNLNLHFGAELMFLVHIKLACVAWGWLLWGGRGFAFVRFVSFWASSSSLYCHTKWEHHHPLIM